MRSPAELTDLLRARGMKVTPQRLCVFRLMHDNHTHPTAEAVHLAARDQMPTLSLRTVYAILDELAGLGEIQILDLGTGAVRFDPHTSTHHHLVCNDCGKVRDIEVEFPGVEVPAGAAQGFEIESAQIVFRGRCAECAAAADLSLEPTANRSPNHERNGETRHG